MATHSGNVVDLGSGKYATPVYNVNSGGAEASPVSQGSLTNRSGTVTTGGAAQQVAAANTSRRYLIVVNLSAEVLWVRIGATAVASQPSLPLKACGSAGDGTGGALVFEGSFVPTGAVSIIGATTGSAFVAWEG